MSISPEQIETVLDAFLIGQAKTNVSIERIRVLNLALKRPFTIPEYADFYRVDHATAANLLKKVHNQRLIKSKSSAIKAGNNKMIKQYGLTKKGSEMLTRLYADIILLGKQEDN